MAYDRKKHDAFILGKEAKKLLFLCLLHIDFKSILKGFLF